MDMKSKRQNTNFWVSLVAATAILAVAWDCRAEVVWCDDFEANDSPAPWNLNLGLEFPGASGSLAKGGGKSGSGAHLAYNLSQGGNYVAMDRSLPNPMSVPYVGFWARADPGVHIYLRLVDETGQVFQYTPPRPLEAADRGAWYWQVIAVSDHSSSWSGANDQVFHGNIVRMLLLAAGPMEARDSTTSAGAVDFDDVQLLSGATPPLDPFNQPLLPPPAGIVDLTANLGVQVHFPQDDLALDIASDVGFSMIRMELPWDWIETSLGVYQFEMFNNMVNTAQSRGMWALAIVGAWNPFHTSCTGCSAQTQEEIAAFGQFCRAAAQNFLGKPVKFEIHNEPNLFWQPQPVDPNQYANVLREAITSVRAVNPQSEIVVAALAGINWPFLRQMLANNAGAGANAVGFHPYRPIPETLTDDLLLYRLIASQLVSGSVVWESEWGYSSTSYGDGHDQSARLAQAVSVVREILSSQVAGFPLIVYYDLRDDGEDGLNKEHNFGLLAYDRSEKPAMAAVRTLVRETRGKLVAGLFPTIPTRLHALRLDGATDRTIVLWTDQPGNALSVLALPPNRIVDFLGNPVSFTIDSGLVNLLISPSTGPLYLSYATLQEPDGATDEGSSTDGGFENQDETAVIPGDEEECQEPDSGADAPLELEENIIEADADSTGSFHGSCGCQFEKNTPFFLVLVLLFCWIMRSRDTGAR
jgi:polysaccharide biosynthesis protein PslG